MTKPGYKIGLSVVVLGTTMGMSALAQSATQTTPSDQPPAAPSQMSVDDKSTYATGKPLESQSKEGFWGHMNPLARKKWVHRQVDPVKDRVNELDQLQAKNANDIRDVDARATAGINKAQSAAELADQHAMDASNRANAAQTTATTASNRATSLNTTVTNLDQYQQVAATSVKFSQGRTSLGPKAKADLDDMAAKLANEKGYIIEVQGYSRSGVQSSQAMADSVVRYLVTEHQVPVYRIYRTGLGKNTAKSTDGEVAVSNGVRVTLLHNSLATMDSSSASNAAPTAPASRTGVSAPPETNQ
ncbi:OmpA family protein [Edaphobacter flagellatus]|uniref:OmpA family protein n=1 Tax=Edaphobacter flagellatus TaxID=1933044 RepID=UPI0021B250A6|nr:OmpA family protein [Edaphobacter flagellatus]